MVNIKLLSILGIFVLAAVGVLGDSFLKISGSGKSVDIKLFIIGFVIYALTAFGWFFVIKYNKLSTLGVFYAISTIIFLLIVGVFYFKESLNSYEIIGIVLAIISLILLGRFS